MGKEKKAELDINKIDSATLPNLSTTVHRKLHCDVMNAVSGHFEPIARIPASQPTRAFHPEPMSVTPAFSFKARASHRQSHPSRKASQSPINSHVRSLRQAVAMIPKILAVAP
ncbi:unnamed protein product [Tuber melanosporum]|uniref:(Perigord truffle) hypothetical protein n=1 Tax=Tuber melanosporum (strain Mel28) TaxID=656061 RepID=D5GD49_TUBMM|nr:uncharacterized protein GSTUM_00000974001 [Tuber melanosporum]CAZ82442.1 unnamed protein product [Tuber melanosporum]